MELHRESWIDAAEARKQISVGFLPLGCAENHGSHLSLDTDLLTSRISYRRQRLPDRTCGRRPSLLTYPRNIGRFQECCGSIAVLSYGVDGKSTPRSRQLASLSVRCVPQLGGHGGKREALHGVCRPSRDEGIYAFAHPWWTAIRDMVQRIRGSARAHARYRKTSSRLLLAGNCVHRDRLRQTEGNGSRSWGRSVHGLSAGFKALELNVSGATSCPNWSCCREGGAL